ncbi:hypothetical protein M433DRAFT_9612 [Acidomyces richmondensis BFW]|nr:hypothetical protein M433DRAFT_9612 [Acidomyces richmondensis BFW]
MMANMTLSTQPERTDAHAGANRELSVERGFGADLAVEALRVGELSTAKVHRYAGKRG